MDKKKLNKFCILGVQISAIDMNDACSLVKEAVLKRQKKYICVCPVSTIMECKRNEKVLTSVNSADLVAPDGMPVVWLGKLKGYKDTEKVYGPDLMLEICRISGDRGYKNYFYGSTFEVLNKLNRKLKSIFPDFPLTGMYSPPFRDLSPKEDEEIIGMINEANPDVLWIGLGSPKQDIWMYEHRQKLNVPVIIGVGAAFDFIAGTKKQAPRWMQKIGMEWLFRLSSEPKRLWKRYAFGNTLFLYLITKELIINLLKKRTENNEFLEK